MCLGFYKAFFKIYFYFLFMFLSAVPCVCECLKGSGGGNGFSETGVTVSCGLSE